MKSRAIIFSPISAFASGNIASSGALVIPLSAAVLIIIKSINHLATEEHRVARASQFHQVIRV